MNLFDAAVVVSSESGKPMHAREVYDAIKNRGIFEFNAKDPVSVVSQTLRKKVGKVGGKTVEKVAPNTYRVT